MRHRILALALALVACLTIAGTAAAKTSITDASVPAETTAGEPFEVGFTLVDHDGALTDDASFTVVARKIGTTEELRFPAAAAGTPLTWSATLTLPDDGSWALRVVEESIGFQQDLASTTAAANPALPVSQADFDRALHAATTELDGQIAGVEKQMLGLEMKVEGLIDEREALRQQVATLQREQDAAGDGGWLAPLLAGLAGATAGALGVVGALRWRGAFPTRTTQPAGAR